MRGRRKPEVRVEDDRHLQPYTTVYTMSIAFVLSKALTKAAMDSFLDAASPNSGKSSNGGRRAAWEFPGLLASQDHAFFSSGDPSLTDCGCLLKSR